MQKEIEKLRKLSGHEAAPVSWKWSDVSKSLKSAGADPKLIPNDLKLYLSEGLFSESLNLTLSLYSQDDLQRFISTDEFFGQAFAAGFFIIGDRDGDFVCVQLSDLVTYLIPAWSITEGFFTKEKRYKDLSSFLKRMAKDLKEEQQWAAEEAEERKQSIAELTGGDVNAMDKKGRTRLILAIEEKDIDTVRSELERGADVNLKRPLRYAVAENFIEAAELLLQSGADPHLKANGKSTDSAMNRAARWGKTEILKMMINRGAELTTDVVQAAVYRRDADLFRFLFEHGLDPNASDEDGPILRLTDRYPDLMALFIEHGATAQGYPDSMLSQLAWGGLTRQLKMLIDAGLEVQGSAYAVSVNECPETARLLLEAGADPNATNTGGDTWLAKGLQQSMFGTKKERAAMFAVMQVFLELGADPNLPNRRGMPPLVQAASAGWFDGFKLLLESGANPQLADADGKTALDYADEFKPKKNVAAAKELLGAN